MEANLVVRKPKGLWQLLYYVAAEKEGRAKLDEDQYFHLVQQFELLAEYEIPQSVQFLDIRPIDEFFELREKGGLFRKINVRVYFSIFSDLKIILVLGFDKKEEEGQTALHIVNRMKGRHRGARAGLLERKGR